MTHLVRSLIGFSLILSAASAAAETYYVPGSCEPKKASLLFENRSGLPQAYWVQIPSVPLDEIRYEVPAHSQLKVFASEFLNRAQGFGIKTFEDPSSFSITWSCAGQIFPLDSWTSPVMEYELKSGPGDLQILNLAPFDNQVRFQIFDASGSVLTDKVLQFEKSYETQRISLHLPTDAKKLKISASGRMHSFLMNAEGIRTKGLLRQPASLKAPAEKVYFLVATRGANPRESFVVGMDDAKNIETAREQIRNPSLEKILLAGISLGSGETNRSFSSRDRSPYSWSVTRIDGFTDFALIDCDGSPDLIEERLMERLQAGGNICFWRYRVIRELSLTEVQRGY